jgi:glycosyltransferase involved in cell wall biosynthesis
MHSPGPDIINLSRIGTNDGGSQTACSFLQMLAEQRDLNDYLVVAFKETNAGDLARSLGYKTHLIGRNKRERLQLDFSCRNLFKRGQLCFTFHGIPWVRSRDYMVNISGAADSNLYYPEIPFWQYCTRSVQAQKYVKDRGRMFGYSRADYWIFETDTLAKRAVDLAGYPAERAAVVKMSPSAFVCPERVTDAIKEKYTQRIGNAFSLLFMAAPNPNKRIDTLIPALAQVRAQGSVDVPIKVVTTLDPNSAYCQTLAETFKRHGVEDAWVNLGQVPYDDIPSLIDACDVVCLLSVLESFSSNFTESWAMNKPLLATDADWARSACGDAAVYVEPTDTAGVAEALVKLTSEGFRDELLSRYADHFKTYPTPAERCTQYLACMEDARRLGCIPRNEHRNVRKYHSKRMAVSQ